MVEVCGESGDTLMLGHLEHDSVSSCWVTKARCLDISLIPFSITPYIFCLSLSLSIFLFPLQGSHVAWDGLKLSMQPGISLNF